MNERNKNKQTWKGNKKHKNKDEMKHKGNRDNDNESSKHIHKARKNWESVRKRIEMKQEKRTKRWRHTKKV